MAVALEPASPEAAGLDPAPLDRLVDLIGRHVADGLYPGCQVAVARHGRLLLDRTFGDARVSPERTAARDDTLWLLYSNTKVVTAAALWRLAGAGALTFHDRIAHHGPGFGAHGKGAITVIQLLTHRAGFPNAAVPPEAMADHALLRRTVAGFVPEWPPGSRMHYHGQSAHWVAGVLIEALTGRDFRAVIADEVIRPLGLGGELFVGLPEVEFARAADMHVPGDGGAERLKGENGRLWREAGSPGAGGYGTARAIAALYQMMLAGGLHAGRRLLSPGTIAYVTRDFTGERVDEFMGMPMHRGLGPHLRGPGDMMRGLGSLAHPSTFGHGGVGSTGPAAVRGCLDGPCAPR